MKKNILKLTLGVVFLSLGLASCTEDIDESARYTRTQETVLDYLRNNSQYSEYYSFISEVKISPYSHSTVDKLLSARGNFVVFAPTNDAIGRYLDSVKVKGIIPESVQVVNDIADDVVRDSLKRVIVHNSVVDFSETQSVFQYISDIAPKAGQDSKTMVYSNLNNRFLKVIKMDNSFRAVNELGDSVTIESYPINGAHTYKCDIQLYNGIVHEMYEVVAPSNDDIVDVLGATSNMRSFSHLLSLCNLSDTLTKQEDELYHELYWSNPSKYQQEEHPTQHRLPNPLEQRLIGFTAFVETDDVFENLNLTGADGLVDLAKLRAHLEPLQPSGLSQGDDYESEDNWLNFFVTYHLLPEMIDFDYLVIHYNELGYRWDEPLSRPTITQNEHYTTMGKPRLLTISEGSDTVVNGTNGKRLNYFAKIARSYTNPFTVEQLYEQGILIRDPAGLADAPVDPVNGKIYPIDELLVYTPRTAQLLGTMRLRINVAALFPELMNNRIRRRMNEIGDFGFTKEYAFLENMTWSDESKVYYLPGYARGWTNYQGDEFNIMGVYDITIKMPPIPYSNTYELRMGVSANDQRGMMQVFFGTDPHSMPAAGLPLDMRVGGVKWHVTGTPDSYIGWQKDGDDEQLNNEVDKLMRLQGFMKAPASFAYNPVYNQIDVSKSLRNVSASGDGNGVRRIIFTKDLEAGQTYYIRFLDALGTGKSQFFLDYFELVPKEVYDNPISPEDIW